jgi:hypothetical protein
MRWITPFLIGLGSLVLLATAAFHFTGYADVSEWTNRLDQGSFFANAVPGIWLFPTLHWVLFALAIIAAALLRFAGLRSLLLAVALLLFLDAGLIFIFIGPFIGSAMLLLSAILFAAAATRLRG